MTDFAEERIAQLIALLSPAPTAWVQAAIELPLAREAIDELVTRALSDDARRRAILEDLDGALRGAGLEPRPQLVAHLRARLGAGAP